MTQQHSLSGRAWAELLLLSLFWGASFLSIRIALDEVGPFTSVAHRVLWGGVVLWAYVFWRRFPLPRRPSIWAAFFVMGALNNVIPFTLMAWGQLFIESGLTSILNASTAIFGVFVAAMVFKDERLTANRFIGITLGFFGVLVAIGVENLAQFDPRSLGQLAVVGGALSYALAGSWARVTLSDMRPEVAAAGMVGASTVMMLPLAYVIEGPMSFDLAPRTWIAILYYAVFATAGAYLLYYRVLAMAGSGNLMLCTLIIPPIAILLGAIFLEETLTSQAYWGFLILALGLVVLDGRIFKRFRRQ